MADNPPPQQQPARGNGVFGRRRRSVQQQNVRRNSQRQQSPQQRTSWRPISLTRHLYHQISDFRMGNWDRSENLLNALMEDLRLRKEELDSRSAIIPLVPPFSLSDDQTRNSDVVTARELGSKDEPLLLSDYLKHVETLQNQMQDFKQRHESNVQETVANHNTEREFIDAWIGVEEKRVPLIEKRANAISTSDLKKLDEYNEEIESIFHDFYKQTHLPMTFVLEQLQKLKSKPADDPKCLVVLKHLGVPVKISGIDMCIVNSLSEGTKEDKNNGADQMLKTCSSASSTSLAASTTDSTFASDGPDDITVEMPAMTL